jgi:hypothetical protein
LARLEGAKIANSTLSGAKPIIQVGPIGSRGATLVVYSTSDGLRFDAGCQRQITEQAFLERLRATHGDNQHAKEYLAALDFAKAHARIWS